MKKILTYSFILLITLGIISCQKDFSKVSTSEWKPEIAMPFIHTSISINNLFFDDSNLVTMNDSLLAYFYFRDSVFSLSADTIFEFKEDIIQEEVFSIGELSMSQISSQATGSMNDMLPYLDQDTRDTLLQYDGEEHLFPSFQLTAPLTIEAGLIEDFIQLTFSYGILYIDIYNSLPISLLGLSCDIYDKKFDRIIKQINISEILPGQQMVDSVIISGLTLGNEFSFIINQLSSPGSFPDNVLINLEQGITFDLHTSQIRVINGQAKIPEQIMYSGIKNAFFDLEKEELYHIIFSKGNFLYTLYSELKVDVGFRLQMLTALIDNYVPYMDFALLAGAYVSDELDISNMYADLSTDASQPYNRLPISYEIIIEPTDFIVEFDSSDKVVSNMHLEEMHLSYADGYMGQQIINISQDTLDVDFDFLDRLQGELILEEPTITLNYLNSIVVPIRIATEFFGINYKTGQTHYLEYDSVDIDIPSTPGTEISGEITIDKTNSSIVDFLAIRPEKIIYYGGGKSNPEGNNINYLYDYSRLIGSAELMVPLILTVDHLNFTDTLGVTTSSENLPVEKGFIKINILNGFPFEMILNLAITDSISGQIFDTLYLGNIAPGLVDENGMVIERIRSEISIEIGQEFLENLRISNQAILGIETNSLGSSPIKLYSDYKTEIAIGVISKINL